MCPIVRTNAEVFSSFTIPQNLWATPTGHTSSPAPHTEVVLSPRATRFPRLVGRLLGGTADQTPTSQVSIGGSCRSDSMDCALEARRLRDELWPTYTFQEGGISLDKWKSLLADGDKANKTTFFETVQKLNHRNSIFVDNTASDEVASTYGSYLGNSISVVTCNKIACSSKYENYQNLKDLAREYNAPFLFETNVGAGLPIIDTLKHLIASGDKVLKIQAVLSGSLNFVFNNFNDKTTFRNIVKQAQEEGYTEPDPKIDLSGIDVMRKILILARESGNQLEIDDIENKPFLPKESLNTKNNDEFFASLKKHENAFQKLYTAAAKSNSKLKYVAQYEDGKASVGLQEIPKGHDFYNLEGSDNIVLFYTERYPNQPMIIKGAGAGAEVTASGIFADVIRIGNF